jgi:DNA-binding SARP family transcriptional activator
VAEAAEKTRISAKYLRALEEDAGPEAFPAPAYARFFLREYAEFLGLHRGSSSAEIDGAMWPGTVSASNAAVRTSATARLRRWFGQDDAGEDFLPRHQGDAVGFGPAVTTDVETWDLLVGRDPRQATTPNLTGALRLVRGLPFEGAHRRRFAWAEPVRERLIAEVVDASFELARRSLLEGRWRSAEDAAAVGLRVEPAQESLWRLRILAAHQSSDPAGEAEAVERLLTITERLECDLQPETEQLLASLKNPGADFDRFMANSL